MRRTLLTIGALILLFAPAASAGLYVGGSVGNASVEIKEDDLRFDEDDTGWKAFVGWEFLKFFAVEGGYVDFGNPDRGFGKTIVEAEVTAVDVFAVGKLPLGIVELFAKAGFVNWDGSVEARGGGVRESGDADGTDAAYGIGLKLRFSKVGVRLEAERFDVSDLDDLFLVSAGVEFHF